jgi:preprotein translocase subunit SecE
MFEKVKTFINEVVSELKKVSWPSRKETVNSTFVVIVLIIILGIFLGFVDGVLAKIISTIIR